MKKLIFILILMFACSCETMEEKKDNKKVPDTTKHEKEYIKGAKSYKTEGWVDDNTFRVTALGFPKKGISSRMRRRYYSKEGAILSAQKSILEKFKGARVKGSAGSKGGVIDEVIIKKEFGGIVSGGVIVEEKYDESDNCQIIYEVYSPGLKKRVMFGVQ